MKLIKLQHRQDAMMIGAGGKEYRTVYIDADRISKISQYEWNGQPIWEIVLLDINVVCLIESLEPLKAAGIITD